MILKNTSSVALKFNRLVKALVICLYFVYSNVSAITFDPIKVNFEYGMNYYYYKEMIIKDETNEKEMFMNLTSSPVIHSLTADVRKYINNRWNSELLITLILGNVDYESQRTGSASGEDNLILALENTINYCFNSYVCANFGYGFRYLDNDSTQSVSTTGSFGYERENYLHFLPVGVKLSKKIENQYIEYFQVRTKYYQLLDGRQISHFKHFGCQDNLKNKQSSGYGFETAIRLYNRDKKWFYGAQIQYWEIDVSDSITLNCFGNDSYGSEPANSTVMAGLIIGYRYLKS